MKQSAIAGAAVRDARVLVKPSGFSADGNAKVRHPAENGTWVWHPEKSSVQTAVLRFRLCFSLNERAMPLIHVTADQRFQLRCDGQDVTFGPDRCDLEHWTVQTFQIELLPGQHELEVLAWWIADPMGKDKQIGSDFDVGQKLVSPPMAQVSWRGGFLLYAEGVEPSLFNTGSAPWVVDDLTSAVEMKCPDIPHYNDIGPSFTFDLDAWQRRESKPPVSIMYPLVPNLYGLRRPGWCLYPAELPEQRRESWTGGRIRAFRPTGDEGPYCPEETHDTAVGSLQGLITKGDTITVPPDSQWTVLWDLEDYYCGYPLAETEGGEGALIEWSWAEALYEESDPANVTAISTKGHRSQIEGKVFLGIGDCWQIGSMSRPKMPSLWWRSGRFVRMRIKTSNLALTITRLNIITTGYPLEWTGKWRSSDSSWDQLIPLFERAFRCSAHETWTDTPYYEQLCYVGDNIMHVIANYAWIRDDRLSRRSIRLFEWGRHVSGLVAERYPSRCRQESATYSLLWPIMVRDYAWWRDDPAFVKEMLPGIRSVLAEVSSFAHEDGLLHHIPGWPFIDWVPEWSTPPCYKGYDASVEEGDSSIVNLHWVLALLAAAQIEEAYGDPQIMEYDRQLARKVFGLILKRYWDAVRGLLINGCGTNAASEHAQTLALLTGLLDEKKTTACLAALRNSESLAKASISFSFYLLDALHRNGDEAELHRRLEFWRTLPDFGFTSTPETPEPSRSDAHAWGAHPAWHTLASIAGIRPSAAGFAKVRISPLPGPLDYFDASMVHPRGRIEMIFQRKKPGNPAAHFRICLPEGITGTLIYDGKSQKLASGESKIDSP